MNWHGVETRKMSWRELWAMGTDRIKFIVEATYDVLPTPQWIGEDRGSELCFGVGSLKHISFFWI